MKIEIIKNQIVDIQAGKLIENTNKTGNITFFAFDSVDIEFLQKSDLQDFCKRNKGIAVYADEELIEVYNDPFASIPLYVITTGEDSFLLTTDFEDCYGTAEEVDRAGLFELLLYGSGIGSRTIFKNMKQFPAAGKWTIPGNQISPYWNFDIAVDKNINSEKDASEAVYNCLKNIFVKYENKNIVMGLSGGLDSRLTACMLSDLCKKEKLFFTFGYHRKIKEYKLACAVTKRLGLNRPDFILMQNKDYVNALPISKKTGGQIAPNHMHMYYCLSKYAHKKDTICISNYYSDAVMGWDAKEKKEKETLEESAYYRTLSNSELKIPRTVKIEIEKDLQELAGRYPLTNGNFSCMDEFIYVVERNPKFHVRLSALCREWMQVELPYADYELLKLMLAIPINLRTEKRVEQDIIERFFFSMRDISSRRYSERGEATEKKYRIIDKVFYKAGYYRMRFLNLINVCLAQVTGDRIQVVNPYLTEHHNIVLNTVLWKTYLHSLRALNAGGYLSEEDVVELSKKERRGKNVQLKFAIISVACCIEKADCMG